MKEDKVKEAKGPTIEHQYHALTHSIIEAGSFSSVTSIVLKVI